jgi:hypothetical protein
VGDDGGPGSDSAARAASGSRAHAAGLATLAAPDLVARRLPGGDSMRLSGAAAPAQKHRWRQAGNGGARSGAVEVDGCLAQRTMAAAAQQCSGSGSPLGGGGGVRLGGGPRP